MSDLRNLRDDLIREFRASGSYNRTAIRQTIGRIMDRAIEAEASAPERPEPPHQHDWEIGEHICDASRTPAGDVLPHSDYWMCATCGEPRPKPYPVGTPLCHDDAVWAEALRDPEFRASLDEGLVDVAAGRVRPFETSSLSPATPSLDADLLAHALVASGLIGRLTDYAMRAHPDTMAREPMADIARSWARDIAAEYVHLSSEGRE